MWGNTGGGAPLVGGFFTRASYSIVQGGFAGEGNLDADPLFERGPDRGTDDAWGTADDDYGDLRLQPFSPAIDAGDNTAVPAELTTDIAGRPRFFDFPGAHDPGARSLTWAHMSWT